MLTRSNLLAAGSAILLVLAHARAGVNPADFSKKVTLTFWGYDRPSTLTNFPVLVVLSTAVDGFSYADFTSPSGADLRFCAGSTTNEVDFEIDHWDTSGTSFVWVRIPELSGTNTSITAYWGGIDTTLPTSATNGTVWAQDYATVWHFDESTRTGPYRDSSPARNTGITSHTLDQQDGVIGNAKFIQNGEYIQTIQDSPITGALARTTSIWLNSRDARGHIFSLGNNDRPFGISSLCAIDRNFHVWWGDQNATATTRTVTRNTWLHAAVSYDGATARLFVNGTQVASAPVPLDTVPYNAIVGSPTWQTYADTYNFQADEFRVSTVARPPDWIRACWLNQSAPASFAAYSRVRNADDSAPEIVRNPATDIVFDSATLSVSVVSTGAAPTQVSLLWGEADAGQTAGDWNNLTSLGTVTSAVPIVLNQHVTGLTPKQTYYYRFYATNAFGDCWTTADSFTTTDRVTRLLISAGSVWQYLDDGSDQGTNWSQIGYDAGNWASGPGELGYGDDDETTPISYGPDPTNKFITTYFRHELVLTPSELASLSVAEVLLRRDDGAVVYLNGHEIMRSNMPDGPIDYQTLAGDATGSETDFYPQSVDCSLFISGTNVVAVEVHQQNPASSDISFDLALETAILYPSIGFYPVPSIAHFALEASHANLTSPAPNDHSGCALDEKRQLIIVPNRSYALGVATLQVYGMDGVFRRMITLPGWNDVESVRVVDPLTDTYAILEEGTGDITLVTINAQTTSILKSSGTTYSSGIVEGNRALEGVAYDAGRNCFYVVKEYGPMGVYCISGAPGNTTTVPLFNAEAVFSGLATDLSDVAYDPQLDRLLILSDEAATLFECKRDGTIVASLPVAGTQPEGVALSADGTELHIVSEPAAYYRYKRDYLSSHSLEGTNRLVRVSMTSPWTNSVSVDYTIRSGTATAGLDVTDAFGSTTGRVTVAPGASETFIALEIVDDGIPEGVEMFSITLGNPVNALLEGGSEYLHVIDPIEVQLVVASAYGAQLPARGVHAIPAESEILCSCSGSAPGGAGVQYVCTGWAGTGSIPPSGKSTSTAPLILSDDSTITWLWETNYWLAASVDGRGHVDAGNTWYRQGTNVVITATAAPYATFTGWSGDTSTNDTSSMGLTLAIDGSLDVTAHFRDDMATNATPVWWLVAHYGPSNDFDTVALSDTDNDGLAAWQEYRAGTIPTDAHSRLAIINQHVVNGGTAHVIYWDSVLGRTYSVHAATRIPVPLEAPVEQLSGTGERLSYTDTNAWAQPTFYRLTVRPD